MISEPKRHHVTVTFHTRGCTCLRAMSRIGAPVSGARSYECSGPKAIRTFAGDTAPTMHLMRFRTATTKGQKDENPAYRSRNADGRWPRIYFSF